MLPLICVVFVLRFDTCIVYFHQIKTPIRTCHFCCSVPELVADMAERRPRPVDIFAPAQTGTIPDPPRPALI